MTEEEERAILWRQQNRAQAQARRDRFVGLAGNRQEREALDAAWAPVLLTALERDFVGNDCEFLEELYVEVPERDVFITEIPDGLLV